ncbi:MAG: DUF2189 domain-containing protein [Serpentinimonas sp.]|nr:DUF2189 domain-containing protein [Serpentinimonas sp.]
MPPAPHSASAPSVSVPRPPVGVSSPIRWLRLGWADLAAQPLPGLLHGLALAGFGWLLVLLARDQFWWLAGAFSGFLIVAPVMATGLYEISRRRELGLSTPLRHIWALWRSGDRRLVGFGVLLGAAGTGWVLTSAGLITLWSEVPVQRPMDFVRHVVLADSPGLFEVWVLLGALLAAPMFASTVLTLPMLVDTRAPVWHAVGESWRAVAVHPLPMALWAFLIALLVMLSLGTLLLGLVVLAPLLGHASWHAYRDLAGDARLGSRSSQSF